MKCSFLFCIDFWIDSRVKYLPMMIQSFLLLLKLNFWETEFIIWMRQWILLLNNINLLHSHKSNSEWWMEFRWAMTWFFSFYALSTEHRAQRRERKPSNQNIDSNRKNQSLNNLTNGCCRYFNFKLFNSRRTASNVWIYSLYDLHPGIVVWTSKNRKMVINVCF